MIEGNLHLKALSNGNGEKALVTLAKNFTIPFIEIFHGLRARTIPLALCFGWGILVSMCLLTRFDVHFFKNHGAMFLYPTGPILHRIYIGCAAFSAFWLWGVVQAAIRLQFIRRLNEAMLCAGLKSQLGRLPGFVFDKSVDEHTRKLRVTRASQPFSIFEKAKSSLEGSLQIYIDEIRENRESGTVDVIYAHYPMPDNVAIDNIHALGGYRFVVGKTRSRELTVSFKKTPHLLVAGQTGGGKSTFLRQLITTLYLNGKSSEFTLIDLKGGLEFQLFENLKRVAVIPDVDRAINALQKLEGKLNDRIELLRQKNCKDIEAYANLPDATPLSREFLVIDEAAEMFLTGHHAQASSIQTARKILSKIARQGRSVGVHLIVSTQRPDAKALDPQVKANLTGVVCFQMLNDASSISVLGNGRATDLPSIAGRAIWKSGAEFIEVQTPYLSAEAVDELLKDLREVKPEPPKPDSAPGTPAPKTEMDNSLDAKPVNEGAV